MEFVYLGEEGLYILRESNFEEDGTLFTRTLPMQKYEDGNGDKHGQMVLNKDYYDGKYSMYFVESDYNYDEMIDIMEKNR